MKKVAVVLGGVAGFLTVCFTCASFHQITAAPLVLPAAPLSVVPAPALQVSAPIARVQDTIDKLLTDQKIEFLPSSVSLTNRSYSILNQVAAILNENPNVNIEIQGHTDNVGPEPSNQTISEWRAGEVRAYLINKGVDEKRLTRVGYGSTHPLADNSTEEGRKQNRRITFLVQGGSN